MLFLANNFQIIASGLVKFLNLDFIENEDVPVFIGLSLLFDYFESAFLSLLSGVIRRAVDCRDRDIKLVTRQVLQNALARWRLTGPTIKAN